MDLSIRRLVATALMSVALVGEGVALSTTAPADPDVPWVEALAPGAFDRTHQATLGESSATYRVDATVLLPLLFTSIPIVSRRPRGFGLDVRVRAPFHNVEDLRPKLEPNPFLRPLGAELLGNVLDDIVQDGGNRLGLGRAELQGNACHAEEVCHIGNVGAFARLRGMESRRSHKRHGEPVAQTFDGSFSHFFLKTMPVSAARSTL